MNFTYFTNLLYVVVVGGGGGGTSVKLEPFKGKKICGGREKRKLGNR